MAFEVFFYNKVAALYFYGLAVYDSISYPFSCRKKSLAGL